jgi:hypothetical protein
MIVSVIGCVTGAESFAGHRSGSASALRRSLDARRLTTVASRWSRSQTKTYFKIALTV